jgi:hypothetical protein
MRIIDLYDLKNTPRKKKILMENLISDIESLADYRFEKFDKFVVQVRLKPIKKECQYK